MPKTFVVDNWNEYLEELSVRKIGRPARIEIFGLQGALLEARSFTFSGISVKTKGEDSSFVEIHFGGSSVNATGKKLLRVPFVSSILARGVNPRSERAVEFETADGSRTRISFENT